MSVLTFLTLDYENKRQLSINIYYLLSTNIYYKLLVMKQDKKFQNFWDLALFSSHFSTLTIQISYLFT